MTDSFSQFVDRLLDAPVESPGALQHRLRDIDEGALRAELVERLQNGGLSRRQLDIALEMFAVIGFDELTRRRLFEFATDPDIDLERRRLGLMALMMDPQLDPMELAEQFGPGRVDELLEANVSMLMQHAETDPSVATEIAGQLLQIPAGDREPLFEHIDTTRRRLGLEAGLVYGALFDNDSYRKLWGLIGGAVKEDGVQGDAEMLQEAADRADDEQLERQLRRYVMELRTRGIERDETQRGFGLFGSCDGTGGFPVLVVRPRGGQQMDVINVLFRTTGEYRDGFVFEVEQRGEIDEIIEQMSRRAGADFIELPVETTAALLEQRLEQARRLHDGLPREYRPIERRLRRLDADPEAIPEIEPADELPDDQAIDELFEHPRYRHWYVERASLIESGITDADPRVEDGISVQEVIHRLAQMDDFVEQTASLADHMAVWHALVGDDETASVFAKIADVTRKTPRESPLIRWRLELTLDEWRREPPEEELPVEWIEDPDLRCHIRQLFFAEIDSPQGIDVLHLALTCLAFVTLDWSLEYVAADRHPRPEQRYELAYKAAREIAPALLPQSDERPEQLHDRITERFAGSSLSEEDAGQLAALILADAQKYIDEYATSGFYEAVAHPGRRMPDEFYV